MDLPFRLRQSWALGLNFSEFNRLKMEENIGKKGFAVTAKKKKYIYIFLRDMMQSGEFYSRPSLAQECLQDAR